jgi:hypothetical protein
MDRAQAQFLSSCLSWTPSRQIAQEGVISAPREVQGDWCRVALSIQARIQIV